MTTDRASLSPEYLSRVVPAKGGEILTVDGEPYMLWPACDAPAMTLACLTHSQRLANIGQLEMHLDGAAPHCVDQPATEHLASGRHTIAAWCRTHKRWEEL